MAVRGRALYARWEIRAFRGIERFSDYKKIKARVRPVKHSPIGVCTAQDEKRRWRSQLSDRGLAGIIAAGTVMLVLIGVATLIVMLL